MNVATKLGLTFNVNKFAVANMYDAANTRRLAKRTRMARKLNDGECVDLSDAFAFGLDQDLLLQYFIWMRSAR